MGSKNKNLYRIILCLAALSIAIVIGILPLIDSIQSAKENSPETANINDLTQDLKPVSDLMDQASEAESVQGFAPNQILINFESTATVERITQILQALGGETIKQYASTPGLRLISLPNTITVEGARANLSTMAEVKYSERNIIYSAQDIPNDPFFNLLWGLHNFGQSGGKSNVDLNAPEAWVDTKGGQQVVIGVLDSGIDYTHPDLLPNIWTNPGEIPNNNIDDDNNGWVDDVHGINAILGNGDPMDDEGHGTHVSGIIAANGNDGIGITGVMWQASIIGCKFLDSNGEGYLSDALTCLDYFSTLSDAGVDIVATNNSWGGGPYSGALFSAIEEQNSREMLFVAAAGNSGKNLNSQGSYPASYNNDNVISVAAIDHNGVLGSFSNYGSSSVDIAAPGVNIYSTMPNDRWDYASGTSMAAPQVTGIIGLTKAAAPSLTGAELKAHILNTAAISDELVDKIINGRRAVINLPFVDGDGDQIDDRWERKYGLDDNDPADGALDLDGDGLSNLEEFILKTLPNNQDSDNDSLTDGNEVNIHGSDPLNSDTDSDGLQDGEEINIYSTDPIKVDTDGDGLSDYAEIKTYFTNPLSSDSDSDTLPDGWEVSFNLDPNDSANANLDPDNDGLTNAEEFIQGTSPILADTDSDGITDYDEINAYSTNPINADTDGDRLADGWEVENFFDPLNSLDAYQDADGDGFSNFQEFKGGTDPHDPSSFPPNDGWYTWKGSADRNPVAYMVSNSGDFTTRWVTKTPNSSYQNHITAVDKSLYLRSPKNLSKTDLIAYSLATGRPNWNKTFFDTSSLSAPTYSNGKVYINYSVPGVGNTVIALDSSSGVEVSSLSLDNYIEQYFGYDGDLFLITTPSIYKIDGSDTSVIWETNKNFFQYTPLAINDTDFVAFSNQIIHSYDLMTGIENGSGMSVSCSSGDLEYLVLDANFAYLYGYRCAVKVDLNTEQVLWEIAENKAFNDLAYLGSNVYLLTNRGVEVRDASDGTLLSSMDVGTFSSMVMTSSHLFLSRVGSTIALDLVTGQQVWSDSIGGLLAIDESGGLIIQTNDNIIKVINLDGDSDSDGILNWWERYYRLNLLDANDALLDTDNDGLNNREEFTYASDPNKADTDDDTLSDFNEINVYQTSPAEPDTDFDGLSDAEEINVYGTSPNHVDSDADGFIDGDEVSIFKTDPNDYISQPLKIKSFAESFESEFPVDWSITGDATSGWSVDTAESTDGGASLRSGPISENQISAFEWVDYFSSGQLTFNLKVTDKSSGYYFYFYIDGDLKYYSTGTNDEWEPVSVFVNAGQRSLRWEMVNKYSSSSQEDLAYIDEVKFKYAPFAGDPNNIIVANSGKLREFTPSGELVAGPFEFTSSQLTDDLVLTSKHEIAIAAPPYIYIYNPDTGKLNEVNVFKSNDYRLDDNIVSISNSLIGTNNYGGVVRFTQDGEFVDKGLLGRFWADLKAGPQEYLYGLVGENYSAPIDRVSVISPDDLTVIREVSLPDSGIFKFTVNDAEEFYFLKGDNTIIKSDSSGNEIKRINLQDLTSEPVGIRLADITSQNQVIYVGSSAGKFYSLTADLTLTAEYEIPNLFGGDTYIADLKFEHTDTDADGLPNWWEIRQGLNPANSNDAQIDSDNDGLANFEEFNRNTYPNDSDTDDDGISDGDEVIIHQTNPRSADTDNDGLSDWDEVTNWNTSPIYNDTDQDGVSDYDEVSLHGLDPLNQDTDGDGQSDGWELANYLSPTDTSDAELDIDNDGLTNLQEFVAGSNIYLMDSDFDWLSDFVEINSYNTLPNKADTDDDGMDDGWEIEFGFDPLVRDNGALDSDNDGYSDLLEFNANSNPIDSNLRPRAPSWETYQGNAQHTGYVPIALDEADFAEIWQAKPLQSFPQRFHQASADHEYAYVINTEGLHVLRLRDGQLQWQDGFGVDYSSNYGQLAIDRDSVYMQGQVNHQYSLSKFDKTTGQNLKTSNYTRGISALAPVLFKNHVFILGGQNGGVTRFDKYGNQVWEKSLQQNSDWSPAVDDNGVYVYVGNEFSTINRFTGSLISHWVDDQYQIRGLNTTTPVISKKNNAIFLQNNRLINLNLLPTTPNWVKSSVYEGQPAVANDSIYVLSLGKLLSLDENTGEEAWRFIANEYLNRNIVVTLNHVFVGSNNKTWAVDRLDGSSVWEWNQGGRLSLSPTGVLLISQDDGNITAIGTMPDDDNDGLPNVWEISSGTQVDVGGDQNLDNDGDGLTNLEELQFGTSDQNSDSDGDGLSDSEEAYVLYSLPSDPDTDRDGLNDGDEVNKYGTDPLERDTDRDGVEDNTELVLGTDPLIQDSDGDEFNDGLERNQGTDPLNADSYPDTIVNASFDFENNQIPTGWKMPLGVHGRWRISDQYSSSGSYALRADTLSANEVAAIEWKVITDEVDIQFQVLNRYYSQDFRFYLDGKEYNAGRETGWHTINTNVAMGMHVFRWEFQPNSSSGNRIDDVVYIDDLHITPSDTDGDTLPNYWERRYGFSREIPNQMLDPDGDGFNNADEFKANTDPTDSNSKPPPSSNPPPLSNPPPTSGGKSGGGGGGAMDWLSMMFLISFLAVYQSNRMFLTSRKY